MRDLLELERRALCGQKLRIANLPRNREHHILPARNIPLILRQLSSVRISRLALNSIAVRSDARDVYVPFTCGTIRRRLRKVTAQNKIHGAFMKKSFSP